MRENVLAKIAETKLIAIVRGVPYYELALVTEALINGGVSVMEFAIGHNDKDPTKENCRKIEYVLKNYNGKICVGAGSVINIGEAKEMIAAGAMHIVSPNFDKAVIEYTRENNVVSIPGAMTATECVNAYAAGADYVKLFPAGELGLAYVKALMAPLCHIPFILVGGVTLENISAFLKLGVKGFGLGSNLILKDAIAKKDYGQIEIVTKKYIDIIKG